MRKILAAVVAAFAFLGFSVPAQAATLQPVSHVVLILEENTGSTAIKSQMPYLTSLGNKYAHTTNYRNIEHPSLPNYLDLTSGSNQGCTNDSTCKPGTLATNNIFHQAAGQWKVWAQGANGFCDSTNHGAYVVRHTAAPYYSDLRAAPTGDGSCLNDDEPFPIKSSQAMGTNKFIFVAPDLNHDAHDGSLGAADAYLKTFVPTLLSRTAFTNGSTLIEITFDETGKNGGNDIYTALLNPRFSKKVISGSYNHFSLLRLNEDLLGFAELGKAAGANDMNAELQLP